MTDKQHTHPNGSSDPDGRGRMGSRSRPVGRRRTVGQRKEWFEDLRTFGIGQEDGKRVIDRLGHILLREHEKCSASTGGIRSDPPVLATVGERHIDPCLPSPPGMLKWRVHRNGGETLVVECSSSSIYIMIVNLCESLKYLFSILSSL